MTEEDKRFLAAVFRDAWDNYATDLAEWMRKVDIDPDGFIARLNKEYPRDDGK